MKNENANAIINDNVKAVYKDNGKSYRQLMSEILQSQTIINEVLQSNNYNIKVVNSCQKRDKRSK